MSSRWANRDFGESAGKLSSHEFNQGRQDKVNVSYDLHYLRSPRSTLAGLVENRGELQPNWAAAGASIGPEPTLVPCKILA